MANSKYTNQKTKEQVILYSEKQIEYLNALLIICKTDDSFIPEFMSKSKKFFKEFASLRKMLKL